MRHVVRATEASDAEAVVAEVLRCISTSALNAFQRETLARQVRVVLASLIEQGRRLAAQGSQMRAERCVEVGGVEVLIRFNAGVRPTLWERMLRMLGGA